MPTGLANRPDQESDVDPLANLADLESQLDARYSGDFRALDKTKNPDPETIKSSEESGGLGALGGLGKKSDDSEGGSGWFKSGEGENGGVRGKLFNRGNGIKAGIITLIIGGGFGIGTIVQGPLQVIHLAQLLQKFHFSNIEDFGDDRSSNLFRNLRNLRGNTPERSRLGVTFNRVADRFEARLQKEAGLRSVYDDTTGRLKGYEVIDREKAVGFLGDAGYDPESDFDFNQRTPSNSHSMERVPNRPSTGIFIDLSSSSFSDKRKFTRMVTKGTKTNKIAGAMGSRLLVKRAGVDFHPLKNVRRTAEDRFVDWYRERREERAERDREGVLESDADLTPEDPNPNDDTSPTNESRQVAEAGNQLQSDATGDGDFDTRRGSVRARLGGGVTVVIGAVCLIREIGNSSEELQHTNIILPMIRMGGRAVATGSQVMTGQDVNMDELGTIVSDLHDESSQTSWAEARSIQAELGRETNGPDIPPSAQPSQVGEKPALFAAFDTGPLGTAASAACSKVAQGILSVVDITGTIKDQLLSAISSTFGIPTPEDFLAEQVTKLLAGEEVNTLAKGAELGNYMNYGARLAANDVAIGMGGRELSSTEVAELDAQSRHKDLYERSQKGLYARIFDIYDTDSVAARMAMNTPRNPGQAIAAIMRTPANFFSSFFRPVHAAEEYDYGFPEFGFSDAEQTDARFSDPFANAEYVEPLLDSTPTRKGLNEKYGGPCFNMIVNPNSSGTIQTTDAKRYDEIEKNPDCSNNSQELLAYRFYVADFVAVNSLSCYEGDSFACQQIGMKQAATTSASVTLNGAVGADTSSQQCTVGQDAGTGVTPQEGVMIRLCNVGGITVNVTIEQSVNKILTEGRRAGLTYSGSGYRSHQTQIELRRAHCGSSHYAIYEIPSNQCSPPTARPGRSLHEWGLAVDLTCNGSLIRSQGSQCFSWLEENQSQHQLKNLPSEPWHWSSTGN